MLSSFLISRNREKVEKTPKEESDSNEVDSSKALMPPLECFYRNAEEDRRNHFFDLVQVNDTVLCRVRLLDII